MTKDKKEIRLDSYDDPLKLFEYLQQIWRNSFNDDNLDVSSIAIEISTKKGIDLCDYAVQAIYSGFNAFAVHHILENVLPNIELNIKSLILYLKTIHSKFQNDLMSGSQYQPIIEITKNKSDFALSLLKELINTNETYSVIYISSILENLDFDGIESRHDEILKFLNTDNQYFLQAIIVALGNLNYDKQKDNELIKKTLSTFDKLQLGNVENINSYICNSLCQMYSLDDEIKNRIYIFAEEGNPNYSYPISLFLLREVKNLIDNEWFVSVLSTFKTIGCEYKRILDNIDSVLYQISNFESKEKIVQTFLTEWILNSDYSKNDSSIENIYNSTLYILSENSTIFNLIISAYLNHDDPKINQVASELINYSNIHRKKLVCLNKEYIESQNFEDIIYMVRKILGYIFDVDSLCCIIRSKLSTIPLETFHCSGPNFPPFRWKATNF